MVGEVKYLRTTFALWRIERVEIEGAKRRWVAGWWITDGDGVERLVELGRWVTWKQAIEAIMAKEEEWEAERVERDKV